LNDYFGQLIALITEHGGDVVKFAGDALLAVWPSGDLRDATLRAAQCALIAQKELHNYAASEDVRLSMRLSIGAGEIFGVHLGGVSGGWEFLIAGEPVIQVSLAQRQAQPGTIVLSPEAWALAQDACAGAQLADSMQLIGIHAQLAPLAVSPPALDTQTEAAL